MADKKAAPKAKAEKPVKKAAAPKAAPAKAAKAAPAKAAKAEKPAKVAKAKAEPKVAVPVKSADGASIVLGTNGKAAGEVKLAPSVFELRPNDHLLYEAVKLYRAGARSGTHQTKSRGDVSGSGKKPWKQKGTGQARVGDKRTPLWRHGGTVFGPSPATTPTPCRRRRSPPLFVRPCPPRTASVRCGSSSPSRSTLRRPRP